MLRNKSNRTKDEYRYNYDPFLVWAKKDSYIRNTEGSHAVYSDRLLQWDYTKYNKCRREVFGNEYQTFSGDSPDQIEKFLRLYNDNPKLELIKIAEGCNVGNGYPYWMFWYKDHK